MVGGLEGWFFSFNVWWRARGEVRQESISLFVNVDWHEKSICIMLASISVHFSDYGLLGGFYLSESRSDPTPLNRTGLVCIAESRAFTAKCLKVLSVLALPHALSSLPRKIVSY